MWQETRYAIDKWCTDNLSNLFDVMLGEEDKLTDDQAHFVIYCLDDDIDLVYAKFLPGVTPVRKIISTEHREMPDWLVKYSKQFLEDL